MKIYLDNCCYNRPYDDNSQERVCQEATAKLYVQKLIQNGELELVTSYMLEVENAKNPYPIRKTTISRFMNAFSVDYIGIDKEPELSGAIRGIMATGIKPKDAAHVACAIRAQCEWFLTTDDRLLKYQSDKIRMTNPVAFVKAWKERGNERQ